MGKMVKVDETLLAQASEITGISGDKEVVEQALRELIAYKAALELAAMGGSDPDARSADEIAAA